METLKAIGAAALYVGGLGLVAFLFALMNGWGAPAHTPTSTTSTTRNTDPTKGWVYADGIEFRCEGPNMIYEGYRENAAVKDDPRCVAAYNPEGPR